MLVIKIITRSVCSSLELTGEFRSGKDKRKPLQNDNGSVFDRRRMCIGRYLDRPVVASGNRQCSLHWQPMKLRVSIAKK